MGYFRHIYDVSQSILIGMGVTLKHMLNPKTVITKQYIGLKTPVGTNLLSRALGVTRDASIQVTHKNCVICSMASKLGMVDHEPTTDPVAVYDRYYRPGDKMSKPIPLDYLPERHRGLHYLETEKCIMCFQCARACPVDCIDIEGTRDVTPALSDAHRGDKVNLTRFTIDYSLCIFCDHCTLACPDKQVCIHMGKEFDLTSFTQGNLVKNLLTDLPFTKDDRMTVLKHRSEIDRLEEEKKKEKAAKAAAAAAAAAAKKAADAAKPAGAAPAAPGAAPAAAAKPATGTGPTPAATTAAPSATTAKPPEKASASTESKAKTDATNQAIDKQTDKPATDKPPEDKKP